MKNKKVFALLLCADLTISMLVAGCSGGKTPPASSDKPAQSENGGSAATGTAAELGSMKSFTAATLDGGSFTQEDIAAKDVTVINFWSMLCGYCIDELPDIAKYAATLPDNVQVITVCLGLDGEMEIEAAKSTLQEAGFTGVTLMEGDGDFSAVCDEVQYTPTTIFVDKDGNTVGDAIVSALDADQMAEAYTQHINDALKAMGQPEMKK